MTNRNQPADGARGLDVELRQLAGDLAVPEPDEQLVAAVLARLEGLPVPSPSSPLLRVGRMLGDARRWLQSRWRAISIALAAALVLVLLGTPAGAKVREWLGFGAVLVEQHQELSTGESQASTTPAPTGSPVVPTSGREVPLAQAVDESSFPIGVPAALGNPDRVEVSSDGRLVAMQWLTSGVRLDQISGALSPYYLKKFSDEVEFTVVNGQQALWLAEPHPIQVLNPDGSERAESARLAGPSLVWQPAGQSQNAGVTLRLEGVTDQQAAVAIAESVH